MPLAEFEIDDVKIVGLDGMDPAVERAPDHAVGAGDDEALFQNNIGAPAGP